jgi:uncharacterized RDD family membrane protein YckC
VSAAQSLPAPSVRRRLASLLYEGLLLLALLLIATFPVAGTQGAVTSGTPHVFFQAYLFAVAAVYFTWFWTHGGQTLPMKTWRFKVVSFDGAPLTASRALWRYVLCVAFYFPACAAIVLLFFPQRVHPALTVWLFLPTVATTLWARFDSGHQFLHDRLAGTRLIDAG